MRELKELNASVDRSSGNVRTRQISLAWSDLGSKSFRTAAIVIGGIELAEKIKKGQFKIGKLGGPTAMMPGDLASCLGCV